MSLGRLDHFNVVEPIQAYFSRKLPTSMPVPILH